MNLKCSGKARWLFWLFHTFIVSYTIPYIRKCKVNGNGNERKDIKFRVCPNT